MRTVDFGLSKLDMHNYIRLVTREAVTGRALILESVVTFALDRFGGTEARSVNTATTKK